MTCLVMPQVQLRLGLLQISRLICFKQSNSTEIRVISPIRMVLVVHKQHEEKLRMRLRLKKFYERIR